MCYKVSKALAESVKRSVDVIYELTKDGYNGTFSSLNNASLMKVLAELVKRGVVQKTRVKKGFSYLWVAESAPTTQFYISVAGKIGSHQKELDQANRSAAQKVAQPVLNHIPSAPTIKSASISELWAELQSRGVIIEDNHLVIIEKRIIA